VPVFASKLCAFVLYFFLFHLLPGYQIYTTNPGQAQINKPVWVTIISAVGTFIIVEGKAIAINDRLILGNHRTLNCTALPVRPAQA